MRAGKIKKITETVEDVRQPVETLPATKTFADMVAAAVAGREKSGSTSTTDTESSSIHYTGSGFRPTCFTCKWGTFDEARNGGAPARGETDKLIKDVGETMDTGERRIYHSTSYPANSKICCSALMGVFAEFVHVGREINTSRLATEPKPEVAKLRMQYGALLSLYHDTLGDDKMTKNCRNWSVSSRPNNNVSIPWARLYDNKMICAQAR